MIRGLFAGAAKGYICQRMAEIGYTVVFVCLFFGISFGDAALDLFDFSEFDVVVFDEHYFAGKHLKSVQPISNTKDYEPYVDSIIDSILEHQILLKI